MSPEVDLQTGAVLVCQGVLLRVGSSLNRTGGIDPKEPVAAF
jgi:hypothetical protein